MRKPSFEPRKAVLRPQFSRKKLVDKNLELLQRRNRVDDLLDLIIRSLVMRTSVQALDVDQ
jgi:hypothetical protein